MNKTERKLIKICGKNFTQVKKQLLLRLKIRLTQSDVIHLIVC